MCSDMVVYVPGEWFVCIDAEVGKCKAVKAAKSAFILLGYVLEEWANMFFGHSIEGS